MEMSQYLLRLSVSLDVLLNSLSSYETYNIQCRQFDM